MAGYRRADGGFTNATTKNDQIERQRVAYLERAENSGKILGIGSNTSATFQGFDAQRIFSNSVDQINLIDNEVDSSRLQNPDFLGRISQNYTGTSSIYENLSQATDLPNEKGPNLAPPDIDALSSGPGTIIAGSNEPLGSENNKSRGFGWNHPSKNEEGTEESTIGTYFSRHYNASGRPSNPPVLGESKSFEGDPINYSQPEW